MGMIFRSFIVRQSSRILLFSSLFIVLNSFNFHLNEQESNGNGRKSEITVCSETLFSPSFTVSYKTENPHTSSPERFYKAESINYSFIKNRLKSITLTDDCFEGIVRMKFFLLTQFATSTWCKAVPHRYNLIEIINN